MTEMSEKARNSIEQDIEMIIDGYKCDGGIIKECRNGRSLEERLLLVVSKRMSEEITQASREGEERGREEEKTRIGVLANMQGYQEGYQKGVEDAAKVAESRQFHSDYQYDIGTCDRIANEIKKLKRS